MRLLQKVEKFALFKLFVKLNVSQTKRFFFQMYLPFPHISSALESQVSWFQIISCPPVLQLWVMGSAHMDGKPHNSPSCLSHHCTSLSFVTTLYKAFRVPCRQNTHSPLAGGDKYLPYHLHFLFILISLLIRIRFPTKTIKVVITRHIENSNRNGKAGKRGTEREKTRFRIGQRAADQILLLTDRYSANQQPG